MMKYLTTMLVGLFLWAGGLLAANGGNSLTVLNEITPAAKFRYSLSRSTGQSENVTLQFHTTVKKKSIPKAVLFSALVPGSGEAYAGSYLKGAAFLVIEAAALVGNIHYNNKGNDLEAAFRTYADGNWVENDYWNWMSQVSGIERSDLDGLRAYERQTFSHFLPEKKNQQYYENIGKYNQFVAGWVDVTYQTYSLDLYKSGKKPDSPLREDYTVQRKDANDNFQRATNLATVIIFNHIISMFDAGWTTKKFNQKHFQSQLRIQGLMYNDRIVPVLNLGVSW